MNFLHFSRVSQWKGIEENSTKPTYLEAWFDDTRHAHSYPGTSGFHSVTIARENTRSVNIFHSYFMIITAPRRFACTP